MVKQIMHTFFYPHPVAIVWDYLTRPELMAEWLMKNDFEPIVGHAFTFRTSPIEKLAFDGIIYCTVLELVPQKKLVYSWKLGPGGGKIELDSIVTWTLREKEQGTELLLEHTGMKEANFDMYMAMNEGWRKNIQKINDLINASKNVETKSE